VGQDIKLSENHDVVIENGDLALVSDGAEVAQSCKIRLLTIEAEWILNFLIGLPWFDKILRVNTSLNEKEGLIKNTIRDTEGVLQVASFELGFDFENHQISIEHETDTIYGPITQRIIT